MAAAPVDLGAPGLEFELGDHICAFYRGSQQRDDVLLPYVRDGLVGGHKCVSVLDSTEPSEVLAPLAEVLDLEAAMASGQLDLYSSDEAYLRDGCFSLERMLGFWADSASVALGEQGYDFVRTLGEMTWALRDLPGVEELVAYEARLNRSLRGVPQITLCLYDLEQFTDGRLLMEMLKTHPKVLMSGQLLENPWYVRSDDVE